MRLKAGRKLTAGQERFVTEYLVDLNATQAAKRAGYSPRTAEWQGPILLRKPHVAAAIQARMDKRAERVDITADNVLAEIAKLAFSNTQNIFDSEGRLVPIHQLPKEVAASISSVKVVTKKIPGTDPVEVENVAEIKFWDKNKSLENLGRHLKLFNDVGSKNNPLTLADLTEDQLLERIAKRRKELGINDEQG